MMPEWEMLPSCSGEHMERLNLPVSITVSANNWSNKEQRRLPIDSTTKWGVWVGSGNALGLEFESLESARIAGLAEAKRQLRLRIDELTIALNEIEAHCRLLA